MRRRLCIGCAVGVGVLMLVACIGPWFARDVKPMLFFGEPVVVGNQGEILLSVSNMPDGGLSAIHVHLKGMGYDKTRISEVAIEGLNGFMVVNNQFDDANGKGSFILLNIFSGVETGEIARLTFTASGRVQDGDFALTKSLIDLVSNTLTPIVDWTLPVYYAR